MWFAKSAELILIYLISKSGYSLPGVYSLYSSIVTIPRFVLVYAKKFKCDHLTMQSDAKIVYSVGGR